MKRPLSPEERSRLLHRVLEWRRIFRFWLQPVRQSYSPLDVLFIELCHDSRDHFEGYRLGSINGGQKLYAVAKRHH